MEAGGPQEDDNACSSPDAPAHSGVGRPRRGACHMSPTKDPPRLTADTTLENLETGQARQEQALHPWDIDVPTSLGCRVSQTRWCLCPQRDSTRVTGPGLSSHWRGVHRKEASPQPAPARDTAVRTTCLDRLRETQKNPEIPAVSLLRISHTHTPTHTHPHTPRLHRVRSLERCAGLEHRAGAVPSPTGLGCLKSRRSADSCQQATLESRASTSRLWGPRGHARPPPKPEPLSAEPLTADPWQQLDKPPTPHGLFSKPPSEYEEQKELHLHKINNLIPTPIPKPSPSVGKGPGG